MSSLQGYIETDYDTLVKAFGTPDQGPDDPSGDAKVTCEWRVTFGGEECSIYDWKEYTGSTPRGNYRWHIGGRDSRATEFVTNAITRGPSIYAQYSNRELETLQEAASALADFAEGTESDDFDKFYDYNMEFGAELSARGVHGY